MRQATCLFVFLFTACLSVKTFSQDYNFRSFSFEQGLSSYNIKKVLQDKYGFLWVATQDGLFRYDGKTFDPFKKNLGSKISIRENFIYDIAQGEDEDLYVSSFNGGVDVVNIRTLKVTHLLSQKTEKQDGLPNLWASKIYFDRKDNLWVGGKDYLTVYSARKKSFTHFKLPEEKETVISVSLIKPVDSMTIAIGVDNYGILLFDIATLKLANTIRHLDPVPTENKIIASDLFVIGTTCFISSGSTIYQGQVTNGSWNLIRKIEVKEKNNTVNCFVPGLNDELWIGTNSGIKLFDLKNYRFKNLDNERFVSENNFIYHLFVDRDKSLWVSSLKNLERIDLHNNFFKAFTESRDGKTKMNHIYGMVYKSPAEVFASGTDGLYLCNTETRNIKRINGTEALGIIHYLYKINDDLWFISSDYGMYAYIPGKEIVSRELFLKLYPEWKPFVNNYFNNIAIVGTKVYWASEEQEGLVIWDQEKRTISQFKAGTPSSHGLPENHLHNIKFDRQGFIWLLFDNSVAKFDPSVDSVVEIIAYKQNGKGFNSGIFFDMYDDGEILWFGTYGGGINGYNRKSKTWTYITESEGLCNNSVYAILPESDSVFWASTNNGISRINFRSRNCMNYYAKDGLHDNSFDETGYLKSGNKLFFAGVNGFTQINLEQYQNQSFSFPVYIKRLEYIHNDTRYIINDLRWDKIKLPPGTSAAFIWLSAMSFSNAAPFSYRIKGYHDDYLSVGDNNKIELNALTHGEYEIDIRYLNEKGEFAEGVIGANLEILPFWYQTWWFSLLISVMSLWAIIFVVRLIYTSRMRKQKAILEKQLAVQLERQRISSEMHDDIGAGLSGIKLLTEMTKGKVKDDAASAEIEKIYQSVGDVSAKVKEVIWSLNTSNDRLSNLILYIQRQVRLWLENYPCQLSITIPEKIPDMEISGESRRNILLVIKEAIHNIIKHSGADKVNISIECNTELLIHVSDNGRGIHINEADDTGNGLKNMELRMQHLHGNLFMENHNGLTLIFKIPFQKIL